MTLRTLPFGDALPEIELSWLSVPVGAFAAAGILLYAPMTDEMATMLAITVFCVSLWISALVSPWFTGLVCLGLIGLSFSTDLALVGFRSPATWLVVLGILLGEATRQSGLATLVEQHVVRAVPEADARDAVSVYRYLLVSLSAVGLALVVLVPSSLVRVLILGPILVSVGDRFTERRAKLGLFLGPLFVTFYAASGVLTGSLANIIITGIVESNSRLSIGWVEWLFWLGPIMAVGRATAITVIAYAVYRPTTSTAIAARDVSEEHVRTSSDERRMLLYLLVGVAVWATDAFHGLHPLYGALAVTLLAFAPRIGVVTPDALSDADFSIVFFLGAIFAIAEGLRRTEFTDLAATTILSYLPSDSSLPVVLAFVVVASIALTFLMEGLAVASVLTPILISFTASAGIPLLPVAMTEAVALNTYFFPYQSAVLVGILGLDMADSVELVRMTALCSLATLLLLVPLQIAVFAFFL